MRSHQVMVGQMRQAFPGIRVISEENDSNLNGVDKPIAFARLNRFNILPSLAALPDRSFPLTELVVWIDPLDATQEYTEGLVQYVTTMVCVAYKGQPVMGVVHKPFEKKMDSKSRWRSRLRPSRTQFETYWAWKDVGHSASIQRLLKSRAQQRANRMSSPSDLNIIVSRSHAGQVREKARQAFDDRNIQITQAGGSGYKTIELIKGNADVYMHNTLIKKWDICSPNVLVEEISRSMPASFTDLHGKRIQFDADQPLNKNGVFASIQQKHEQLIQKYEQLDEN